ncbi:hypothetical protein [Pseudomonas fragi]|uniref:hypothetical protein n=1 Tax=Pseudomonas fragi TaxID=296 RepID=UPI001473719A|nr:hypothetical protein [Pseudomonas fragi]NNB55726.1 hypothetical protein [Pseudomonas fragi]
MHSLSSKPDRLTPETLAEYKPLTDDPLDRAIALRDFVFSHMPIGSTVTKPYWFSPETEFSMPKWHLMIPVENRPPLTRVIDFDIKLYDKSNLLDAKNKNLLLTFKYFFAYQIHPRYTGGQIFAPEVAYVCITRALQIADWILLNGERFKICEFGLSLINENSILNLLDDITKKPISEAVYDYSKRITTWIKQRILEITKKQVASAIKAKESISEINGIVRALDLNDQQLISARVMFTEMGFYTDVLGMQSLRAAPIIADIYKNTFNGGTIKPKHFTELDLGESRYRSEFPPVEVRATANDGASHRKLSSYVQTFRKIGWIKECSTGIDNEMLLRISKDRVIAGKNYRETGRYRTAPVEVVLHALRSSIEYSIENIDWILEEIRKVIEAKLASSDYGQNFNAFSKKMFSETALANGIRRWAIPRSEPGYYDQVRENSSLVDLYQVLTGSVFIVLGTTMARRRDEVAFLDSETCLYPATDPNLPENSSTRYYLVFKGQKTGASGIRETLKRPLLRIAAIFIWKLKVFNKNLCALGIINAPGRLFKSIGRPTGVVSDGNRYTHYNCINSACDYFQLPTIANDGVEKRYYTRQHQLRRFFAIAFFWGSDDPDYQTLSYMIGHTDAKLFYHYVTELVTGRVLKEAKANRIHASLSTGKSDIEGMDELIDMLRREHNVKRIHIKTYNEVFGSMQPMHKQGLIQTQPDFEDYIKSHFCEESILEYLEQGKITLEPNFFEIKDRDGRTVMHFNLALKVKDL